MKKYVKPELFYERYELTEQIADCAWEVTYSEGSDSCVSKGDPDNGLEGLIVFGENSTCNLVNPSMEIYCYTTGAGGYNSFVS